jgi:hypothetical protein
MIVLTLEQLIAEATALPDSEKTILLEKIEESLTENVGQERLKEDIEKAQKRLTEIESLIADP